jgi:hypothetical protein
VEVKIHAVLTLALDEDEWSVSCPSYFTPRERAPHTHWIGGWVGPQSQPGCSGEEKNSQSLPGLKPLIIQPIAQLYTTELSWLLYTEKKRVTRIIT